MNYKQFREVWDKELRDVSFILHYLHTYPEVLKHFKIEDLLTAEEFIEAHEHWFNLVGKYYGLEKEFFKPHWVPLQKYNHDFLIDLSDPNYPVFEYSYIFIRTHFYQRLDVFDSVNELMLIEENHEDVGEVVKDFEALRKAYFSKFYAFDFEADDLPFG